MWHKDELGRISTLISYFTFLYFTLDRILLLLLKLLYDTREFFRCCLFSIETDITYLLISIKMWLASISASILIINTLTMLTIGHADRGRPTLKLRWRAISKQRNSTSKTKKVATFVLVLSVSCPTTRKNIYIYSS